MRQTATIALSEPTPLRVGQVWAPVSEQVPGIAPVRIICRYPFATPGEGVVWVVEHLDAVQRIERVSESTLTQLWFLDTDAPAH